METPENITMILPETGTLLTRRGKKQKKLGQAGSSGWCPDRTLGQGAKKAPSSDGTFVIRMQPVT
jgi:hypothetical protein